MLEDGMKMTETETYHNYLPQHTYVNVERPTALCSFFVLLESASTFDSH